MATPISDNLDTSFNVDTLVSQIHKAVERNADNKAQNQEDMRQLEVDADMRRRWSDAIVRGKEDLVKLKMQEADFVMKFLSWWSMGVMMILFFEFFIPGQQLPTAIYVTLLGTTLGQVFGLEWLVLNHCFPGQKPDND